MPKPRLRNPRLFASWLAALAMLTVVPAWGQARDEQAPAAPKQPVVVPPVVKANEGAQYPQRALSEGFYETVEVLLVLTIDANGGVRSAVVDKPAGHGFDEAALEAAQRLAFEPATRDGKPVAARTRFVYRFTPPPAVLAGRVVTLSRERPITGATVVVRDPSGRERSITTGFEGTWRIEGLPAGTYHVTVSAPAMAPHEADETLNPGQEAVATDRLAPLAAVEPPPPSNADGGSAEVVEEVEVRGEKPPREVTKRTLEQREISRIPGTNGDALRSLQNLPGVGRPPGGAGLLIVRGSAPQDTQYFVDGTPVPLVYHFGGLSSVVPTEMLDRIDFYPGNFSAQYGRAMGGIVDVGLTDPKKDKLRGFVQADLIDTRVFASGPLFDTGWTFAVAGRRSWFDVWLGPVLKAAGAGVSVAPVYYDYQALLERDLGKRSSVRFAFFGSDDRLAILLNSAPAGNPTLTGGLGYHTGFWRAQALYRNRFGDNTELRVVAATGEDYFEFNAANLLFNVTEWPITSRVEIAQKLEKRLTMNVGLDLIYEPYAITVQAPPLPKPGQPPPGPFSTQPPLFTHSADSIYQPAFYTEWEATPWAGTRIVPGIRLDYTKASKSWDLAPRFVVRQDITRAPRTTLKAGAGLFTQPPQPQETNAVFGTPGLTSNRAYHYDVGVERELTRYIEASVEGFYKQLDNLVSQGLGNTGTGIIYGAETLIRYKPDERFFGWLAYTLSRSERREAPGMPLHLSQYDETHILTVLGSYRLGKGWEFGARYRLTSGYMYSPQTYGYYDENIGTYLALQSQPPFNSRLPLFNSLDLRVDKTWVMGWGKIGAYLDVLNVFNNGNVAGISYNYNSTQTSYASDLPILPSLGLRVEM
ncbi:MAG TPA: TonB family protein [Polyangiaceae bacterium]|nr:TonB family protein [Polyangiaceae bacterium]